MFIKRREPYIPSPTGQIPLDAKYELPTEYCDVHESEPVITTPDENDDDWFDDNSNNGGWFNDNGNNNGWFDNNDNDNNSNNP